MKPYALISDTHNHNWSAFSTVNEDGINTRLIHILDEFERCAKTLAEAGGTDIYHAGDLFHVRGSITPSVLNPTRDRLDKILSLYRSFFTIIGGNHDFEGKNADRLGNAVEAVRCGHVSVISAVTCDDTEDGKVLMVPWIDNVARLKETITEAIKVYGCGADTDLIIHAPIDGVIMGLPNHGLTPEWLAALGMRRVFAGHYHNAKDFGNGVYSIGALTHQTWSDVGTRAGFWIVDDKGPHWHASHAPNFIAIDHTMDETTIAMKVPGNYVRAHVGSKISTKQINELREWLNKLGAQGVRIDVTKEPSRVREAGATMKVGSSVEVAIADYVKTQALPNGEQITIRALNVLAEAA